MKCKANSESIILLWNIFSRCGCVAVDPMLTYSIIICSGTGNPWSQQQRKPSEQSYRDFISLTGGARIYNIM